MKGIFVSILLLILLLNLNCATTGPGGKKSFIFIGTQDEVGIGKQLVGEVEKTEKLYPDTVVQKYVNKVGQKVVSFSDRKDLQYTFKVLDSKEINAFACPGGYIYVYSGLLKIMDNEAQLAGVLGHEIGHVVARHGVKRLQQALGAQVLLSIALGQSSELTNQAVSTGVGLIMQGYSRDNEFEADYDGAYYMTEAGYSPLGMTQLLTKLDSLGGKGNAAFLDKLLATHPPTKDRIARTTETIGKLTNKPKNFPLYEEEYLEIKKRIK
jgi:predicted Zn-dependent protease